MLKGIFSLLQKELMLSPPPPPKQLKILQLYEIPKIIEMHIKGKFFSFFVVKATQDQLNPITYVFILRVHVCTNHVTDSDDARNIHEKSFYIINFFLIYSIHCVFGVLFIACVIEILKYELLGSAHF